MRPDPDDPACSVECFPIAACETQACCDDTTGACAEVVGLEEVCPGSTVSKGFGTDCDPNCCAKPSSLYTGADNISLIVPPPAANQIVIPALGEPNVSLTITGSNVGATYDDFPDICDSGIFDPDGGFKDPGWWEGFELIGVEGVNDCAQLRLDFCCTDIDGNALKPGWAGLNRNDEDGGVLCDSFFGNVGVDPPLGEGRGTSGFARGGPFCAEDNLWQTFDLLEPGDYYYSVYSAPDGTGASPPGAQYQLHLTVRACPKSACCVDDTCTIENERTCNENNGFWHPGVVDCGTQPVCDLPDSDGFCCIGSCCLGPGDCTDDNGVGGPMTLDLCLDEPGEPEYIGGVACADNPCPTCGIEGDANCHDWDTTWFFTADRFNGGGRSIADDFNPVGSEIRQICWWGMYAIAEQFLGECAAENIPTEDLFEIRIREDNNGVPGAEIAGSPGPVTLTAKEQIDDLSQLYSVVLDTPIPVDNTKTYWIEISGEGNNNGECQWWMGSSYSGNLFSYWEFDPNMEGWSVEDRTLWTIDFAICLDTGPGSVGFELPDPPTGACCECSGTCTDDVVWNDCSGGFDVDTGALVGSWIGQWEPGDTCPAREVACTGEAPPGDDCGTPMVLAGAIVSEQVSTVCSTTDGASTRSDCDNADLEGIENDIWIEYTAAFGGTLDIDLCGDVDWDVVLEVFSDGTCPATCPPDAALRVPNFALNNALCTDGVCDAAPNPTFRTFADEGQCFLIRIGGEPDPDLPTVIPVGRGLLSITSVETVCPISLAPVEDPNTPEQGSGTKNKYLSFDGAQLVPSSRDSAAETHAIRVKFISLPGFEFAEDRAMFVQEPFEVTEASGSSGPTPPPTYLAAELGCNAFYADWTNYGVVDVYDDAIIPDGVYDVQAIHADCERNDANYSVPALTNLMSSTGDVVRDCGTQPCSPPNGTIDFVDISAVVDKFRNLPTAPRKARADVINSDIAQAKPDKKVDFVDISHVVDAFRNIAQPPVGPPATERCPGT